MPLDRATVAAEAINLFVADLVVAGPRVPLGDIPLTTLNRRRDRAVKAAVAFAANQEETADVA